MKRITDADQERLSGGKATKPLIKSMKKVGPHFTSVSKCCGLEELVFEHF